MAGGFGVDYALGVVDLWANWVRAILATLFRDWGLEIDAARRIYGYWIFLALLDLIFLCGD